MTKISEGSLPRNRNQLRLHRLYTVLVKILPLAHRDRKYLCNCGRCHSEWHRAWCSVCRTTIHSANTADPARHRKHSRIQCNRYCSRTPLGSLQQSTRCVVDRSQRSCPPVWSTMADTMLSICPTASKCQSIIADLLFNQSRSDGKMRSIISHFYISH